VWGGGGPGGADRSESQARPRPHPPQWPPQPQPQPSALSPQLSPQRGARRPAPQRAHAAGRDWPASRGGSAARARAISVQWQVMAHGIWHLASHYCSGAPCPCRSVFLCPLSKRRAWVYRMPHIQKHARRSRSRQRVLTWCLVVRGATWCIEAEETAGGGGAFAVSTFY
jgi:hypothetical protein